MQRRLYRALQLHDACNAAYISSSHPTVTVLQQISLRTRTTVPQWTHRLCQLLIHQVRLLHGHLQLGDSTNAAYICFSAYAVVHQSMAIKYSQELLHLDVLVSDDGDGIYVS